MSYSNQLPHEASCECLRSEQKAGILKTGKVFVDAFVGLCQFVSAGEKKKPTQMNCNHCFAKPESFLMRKVINKKWVDDCSLINCLFHSSEEPLLGLCDKMSLVCHRVSVLMQSESFTV